MPARTRTRPAQSASPPPVDDAPTRRRPRRRPSTLWLFVIPALALYTFVVLIPSGRGALLAFTDWDGLSPDRAWVGLENFRAILEDDDARAAVGQTLLVAVAITIVQNAIGLLLALGVNSRIKSRNVLRVFLFAPAVMTPVVVGALWKNLLAPDGAVNSVLDGVGLGGLKQDWLGDPNIAIWSVVGVIVWQFAGYSMVIFLAGLQGIPQDVYEAAEVDGAGPVRRFRHVVFPLLAPATTINLMLSIIGGLKLFDQVWVMTGGGPGHSSETLSTLIYKDAFQFGEFAYSVALAIVLTIFVALISSGQYWLLRRREGAAS
ncbi:carbohydrate ABC transporter permease [Cryptosporangium aurantiacum]|uniref:Carbohydrate ABC transporter membrane protein 1, CUT1 family n=1 Tax=Cryptosporangium aurantiacum TaxID=134849 RepID=A0A1M7N946_9ACTN|nr:sugar ABC transporter permease [Cryptosporangium aurantiacum]SHN00137.1 carbohydrate ABC transporter membrane protein 1, CUT1 family [Cryptosporangium aurantiacum]